MKHSPSLNSGAVGVAGKAVIVTGGTTGIGRATAILLARQGARVLTFGRHRHQLRDAQRDFADAGLEIVGLIADAATDAGVRAVFREADRKFGRRLDVLINNAAIGAGGLLDTPWKECDYAVRSNVSGYLNCAQQALQRMKRHRTGHIINVGSVAADSRKKGSSVYVATKSAIQGFSEAFRKEVNPLGVRVSLVEPGRTGTDMQDENPREQRRLEARGEMLTAEDIAQCVLYCLTQPLRVDVTAVQVRPARDF